MQPRRPPPVSTLVTQPFPTHFLLLLPLLGLDSRKKRGRAIISLVHLCFQPSKDDFLCVFAHEIMQTIKLVVENNPVLYLAAGRPAMVP